MLSEDGGGASGEILTPVAQNDNCPLSGAENSKGFVGEEKALEKEADERIYLLKKVSTGDSMTPF